MKSLLPLLLFAPSLAMAFRLDPMVAELSPKGDGRSKVFRLENNGTDRVALKMRVTTRAADENGKESRGDTADFSVYPEQLSLAPNDARNVRVTYKGPAELKAEAAYRLIATQLPVDFKAGEKKTQVNFLFEYVASLYVKPAGVFPRLQVRATEWQDARRVKLTLENTGTAHRLLQGVRPEAVLGEGKKAAFKNDFKAWDGENMLPGETRVFLLETKEALPEKIRPPITLIQTESP